LRGDKQLTPEEYAYFMEVLQSRIAPNAKANGSLVPQKQQPQAARTIEHLDQEAAPSKPAPGAIAGHHSRLTSDRGLQNRWWSREFRDRKVHAQVSNTRLGLPAWEPSGDQALPSGPRTTRSAAARSPASAGARRKAPRQCRGQSGACSLRKRSPPIATRCCSRQLAAARTAYLDLSSAVWWLRKLNPLTRTADLFPRRPRRSPLSPRNRCRTRQCLSRTPCGCQLDVRFDVCVRPAF
jgi:hypothetical protein